MNLIIDVGNTRVKVALFKGDSIFDTYQFAKSKIAKKIKDIVEKHDVTNGIISSVASISEKEFKKIEQLVSLLRLNHESRVPFKNEYATPITLGVDRIALASASVFKFPNKNVLVIDAGTCITYDFIDKKGVYYGGAIAPGIEMRYKSLYTFTDKLPLLDVTDPKQLTGNSTEESIHSGIVNGILSEIEGVIDRYKEKNKELTVVLTGGDTNFLAKRLKNSIFANPNFLLEGLNNILNYNLKND
ncbi:MAG: type III pantothenate kinase [Roseivirga sp.]|jgi:type III pantothenate kinase